MFHRHGKKTKASNAKALSALTRVVQASNLLAEDKRATLLQQIKDSCALEEGRLGSLCISLIHNFVNHCQSLPETSNSFYSQQGGFLDHALNRTEAALALFKGYLLRENQDQISEEQKLWQYALFSAAILQGIGKLQTDFDIELYDSHGHFLKKWNPLLENLASNASHYRYEFLKESDEGFRHRLNLLLARLLMPTSGFAWIASNSQVLAVWLALLNEDNYAAGTLGAILIHADAIAIQRYFNQMMVRGYGSRGSRYGRVSTFAGGVPESVAEIEQQVGVEFIQWIGKSLNEGRIMINKAPLFMVPGGLLMSVEMFRLFVREHPEYKNWQAVQNGFLSLGLHRTAADGNPSARFEQASNQQMHSGIVFSNYPVALPAQVSVHHLGTGKISTMSTTELIYQAQSNNNFIPQQQQHSADALPHLNSSGQWQAVSSSTLQSSLKPGMINSV
ncbi:MULTISPECIES: TraI domain-containing protein [unclassified Legionella]|uniref:TraI domain-containing protein n=1 Tax=unclassified Legionella TaxID=2622702 RepID=UPI0010558A99|nr:MULTISPECIES: TraI domain-containing protein [unclassified Legionella]MDI9818053.1 TraI domain-containing protein [Legionella sp. PL877]